MKAHQAGLLLVCCLYCVACGNSKAHDDATSTASAIYESERDTAVVVDQTATAIPIFSTATALSEIAKPAFGPIDTDIEHNPNSKLIPVYEVDQSLHDFIAEATFFAPYDASEAKWDVGFLFRSAGEDDQFRLILTSEGEWYLTSAHTGDPPTFDTVAQGTYSPIPSNANDTLKVRLVAIGAQGYLFLNGDYITDLDLSAKTQTGTFMAATGLFEGDTKEGATTKIKAFQIWEIER